jgi:hypothetical protein
MTTMQSFMTTMQSLLYTAVLAAAIGASGGFTPAWAELTGGVAPYWTCTATTDSMSDPYGQLTFPIMGCVVTAQYFITNVDTNVTTPYPSQTCATLYHVSVSGTGKKQTTTTLPNFSQPACSAYATGTWPCNTTNGCVAPSGVTPVVCSIAAGNC